jgi:hypothetical protein
LVQAERDKKRAGEVMLSGLDELEDNLSLAESKLDDAWPLNLSEADASKLQLLRQELFEIRGLLD